MKNYARVLLYAYPLLETVGKDYEEHIKNKAVLSYGSTTSAEEMAEYLAGEILEMRRLEWLKGKLEEVFAKLNAVEKALLSIRYFGEADKLKGLRRKSDIENSLSSKGWTERTYFRRQIKLGEKLSALLLLAGLTEEVYLRELAKMEIFTKIQRYVEGGGGRAIEYRSNVE